MAKKPKYARLHVRMTAAEKRAFTKAAENAGLSLSTWLRQVARKEAGLDSVGKGTQ